MENNTPDSDKKDAFINLNNDLLDAIQKGDLTKEIVKSMVYNFSTSWYDGCVPLWEALSTNQLCIARYLLEAGTNMKQNPEKAVKILHYTIMLKDIKLLELLLSQFNFQSLNINAQDENGETPLLKTIKMEDYKLVNILLRFKPDLEDEGNRLALIYAIQKWTFSLYDEIDCDRKKSIITNLLNYGYTFKVNDTTNKILLYKVVRKEFVRALEILLKLGANPDEIIRNDKETMFQIAIECDNKTIMDMLLKYGANINHRNSKGQTYLIFAILNYKKTEMITYIINKGVDINAEDDKGKTALDYVDKAPTSYRDILFTYKINPNHVNKEGKSLLYKAVKHRNHQVINLLVKNGAIFDERLVNGLTPLQFALEKQSPRTVLILLLNGADPDVQDEFGRTALHIAISKGYRGLVYALLNYDADITIRDNEGRLAIDLFTDEYNPWQNRIFNNDPYNGCMEWDIFYLKQWYNSDYNFILAKEEIHCDDRIGLPIPQMYKLYEIFINSRIRVLSKEYNSYQDDNFPIQFNCMVEVAKMRNDVIWKNIKCLDIFYLHDSYLAKLIQNETFAQCLKNFNYKKYKYYANMLRWRVRDITEYANLREAGASILYKMLNLPNVVIFEIINYLQSKEIRTLLRVQKT